MTQETETSPGAAALIVSLGGLIAAAIVVLRALALQLLWNSGIAHIAHVDHLGFGPALAIGLATLILLPSPLQKTDTVG